MNKIGMILYALSLAFFIVEALPRIRLLSRKPFNCMMCMTGWCSLSIALWQRVWWPEAILLCLVGVFVGAMFDAIKMRWL